MDYVLAHFETASEKDYAQRVLSAFAGVTLGDGIGFEEADCIDERMKPDNPIYMKWRAADERENWLKIYDMFHDQWLIDQTDYYSNYCFMDAKGLLFHLPPLLLVKYSLTFEFLFDRLFRDINKQHTHLNTIDPYDKISLDFEKLLTPIQKQLVVEKFEAAVKTGSTWGCMLKDGTEVYYCESCHCNHFVKVPMTEDEIIEEMKSTDVFPLWQFFKERYRVENAQR